MSRRRRAAGIRTTVALDADLVEALKNRARRERTSFAEILNEVVRRGIAALAEEQPAESYSVAPHRGGFRPGIAPGKLNQLLDQLDADDLADKQRR